MPTFCLLLNSFQTDAYSDSDLSIEKVHMCMDNTSIIAGGLRPILKGLCSLSEQFNMFNVAVSYTEVLKC